jgi:hypothetical protein
VIRLLIFLVTGLLCAIGGVLIGVSSHQVAYRNPGREIVAHFLSGGSSSSNRIGYLQMVDDDNLYILNEDDFSPPVKDNSFGDGDTISFIYRPVDTTSINVSATNTSTHLQGQAYVIEQFTVLPSNGSNGVTPVTYTSSEYSKDPRSYFQSNWLLAGGLLALGLLLVVVGFILQLLRGRKKAQVEINVTPLGSTPPLTVAMPTGQYEQQQVYAYQQPFQNFPQYPQTQQYQSQYSPSPGQYWAEGVVQEDQTVEQQQPRRQFQPRPGQFKSPQSRS